MKVVVAEEKEEVEFLGTENATNEKVGFRSTRQSDYETTLKADESYRCLFYNNRTCHVREQLEVVDKDLQTKTVIKEEIERTLRSSESVVGERLVNQHVRNTADWLVNNFCSICPHLN